MADPKTFTVVDVLAEVGVDNLTFQFLSDDLTGTQSAIKKTKQNPDGGSSLRFATGENLGAVVVKRTREALVIWMDRDKMDAAWAKLKSGEVKNA